MADADVKLHNTLEVFEKHLTGKTYFVGEQFTLAGVSRASLLNVTDVSGRPRVSPIHSVSAAQHNTRVRDRV